MKNWKITFFCFVQICTLVSILGCSNSVKPVHKSSATEWTSFRGNLPQADGTATEKIKPPLYEFWTFKAKDEIRSSPVLSKGILVFGSNDGSVYGVNPDSGKKIWEFKTEDVIIASPLVINDRVYIGSFDKYFYELDLKTGRMLRKFETSLNKKGQKAVNSGCVIKSSAATDGRSVFFGCNDRRIYALDLNTFQIRWTYQTNDWVEAAPLAIDGRVYCGSNDGNMYAFDADSGVKIWEFPTSNSVYSTPAILDGNLYFTSWDGNVYSIKAETGQLVWKTKIDEQASASPAIVGGTLVVGGMFNGGLAGIDVKSGKIKWEMNTSGGFDAGSSVSGNIVYVGSMDNYLYAVNPDDGKVIWKVLLKDTIRDSCAIANNALYVGTRRGVMHAFTPGK